MDVEPAPLRVDLTLAPEDRETRIAATMTPAERETLVMRLAHRAAPRLAPLGRWLLELAERWAGRELTTREKHQALLAGVGCFIVYVEDPELPDDADDFADALWTFTPRAGNPTNPLTGEPKGEGDCEDMVIAFVALVLGVGLVARGAFLAQQGAPFNHFAAKSCDPYCEWVETTIPGALIGEHPWAVVMRLGGAGRVVGVTA